ncbi:MAG: ATP-binding protein [Magnetococcales bacterium]|nr:ATP-binding protein [Magnetococcales bacterium]
MSPQSADFPLDALRRHLYMIGATGYGKTELIKKVIYGLSYNPDITCTTMFVTPHEKDAREIARWKENAQGHGENLIYIDMNLLDDWYPVLNPFEIVDRNNKSEVDIFSNMLTSVIDDLVANSELSPNMVTLLVPCVSVVIKYSGSLVSLQDFMDENTNEIWITRGLKSENPMHRRFFKYGFHRPNLSATKNSVYIKLQQILNSEPLYRMLCGKSTINIREIMNSKKLVVWNLSPGDAGDDPAIIFGRFVIAIVQSLALMRKKRWHPDKRVPLFLYIDECQDYMSYNKSVDKLIRHSRKFGLHLGLIQQSYAEGMSAGLAETVKQCMNIQICGTSHSPKAMSAMAGQFKVKPEVLAGHQWGKGEFVVKVGEDKPYAFYNKTHLLEDSNAM